MTLNDRSIEPVLGATPADAHDPQFAARAVREMFTSIAPRYDLLNHVLSFNVDRLWWRRAARTFTHILRRPDAKILDLCCGTGDMTGGGVEAADLGCRFFSCHVAARFCQRYEKSFTLA